MIIVEGGCGDIDHEIGMLADQLIHGADPIQWVIANVPDVFANGEGDLLSFKGNDGPLEAGFEIAVFVEDVVIGQAGLVCDTFYLFFV